MNLRDPLHGIEQKLLLVRGHWVLLDVDAADFYQVQVRALRMAVSRNLTRFARGFVFKLSKAGAREFPEAFAWQPVPAYAFTKAGVAMLSSVLKSKKAIQVSIDIIRYRIDNRRLFVELGGYDGLPKNPESQ